VWEFLRSNPHWGGVSCGDTAGGLGEVITPAVLDRLVRREGVTVLYTHLGKVADPRIPFPPPTQQALRNLSSYVRDSKILVTTTHRLLRYLTVRDGLRYGTKRDGETLVITLESVHDPVRGDYTPSADDVQGITFEARRADHVELHLRGVRPITPVVGTGDVTYITVPWKPLTFPVL
jgi:hypothetical protein